MRERRRCFLKNTFRRNMWMRLMQDGRTSGKMKGGCEDGEMIVSSQRNTGEIILPQKRGRILYCVAFIIGSPVSALLRMCYWDALSMRTWRMARGWKLVEKTVKFRRVNFSCKREIASGIIGPSGCAGPTMTSTL